MNFQQCSLILHSIISIYNGDQTLYMHHNHRNAILECYTICPYNIFVVHFFFLIAVNIGLVPLIK